MSSSESHLLFVGQQCHAKQCYMVDFLPFRCDHCTNTFCADHYKPTAHSCDKYDAAKHDRIAPPCPLCNTPVAIPPQQDPNVRMEQHIETECSVTTGRRTKPGSMPVCARAKCGKVLFAPIKCNSCRKHFCAAHRFPSTHTCSATPASSKPPSSASTSAAGSNLVNQTSAASAAAMAAIKRNMANVKPAAARPKPSPPATPMTGTPTAAAGSSTKTPSPFSKTDRRAKAEQESRRRAMKERAKKGLLSEREQVMLAEEEAAQAATSKKDSDCVVA